MIGAEQNGFWANRSCSDNLFVLNTILEINLSKKLLTHLLFVDLKVVYDRLDRGVLGGIPGEFFKPSFCDPLHMQSSFGIPVEEYSSLLPLQDDRMSSSRKTFSEDSIGGAPAEFCQNSSRGILSEFC